MFSCKRASEREAARVAGAAGIGSAVLVGMHSAICGMCRRQFAQLRLLDRACARLAGQCLLPPPDLDAALSPAARARIRAAVEAAEQGNGESAPAV